MSQPCEGKVRETRQALTLAYSTDSSALQLQCTGFAARLAGELQPLFLEAGAVLSLDVPAGPSGTEHGFALDSRCDTFASPGMGYSRVCGLPGVVRGLVPSLDVLLATVTPECSEDALRSLARRVEPALGSAPRVLSIGSIPTGADLGRIFPDATISLLEAASAVDRLLAAPEQVDLVLAPPEYGELFERLALGLTGTHSLSTRLEARNDALVSYHAAAEGAAVDPAALVLAAVGLLAATGRDEAAECLHNALLKTLEEGVHTDAMELLNPYGTRVAANRMIEAIGARLGQLPRRLAPAHYRNRPRSADRSHLKQVV